MKASVDADTCTGCGLCMELCPDVFKMEGNVAITKVETVPVEAEDACRDAMESCPVSAIDID